MIYSLKLGSTKSCHCFSLFFNYILKPNTCLGFGAIVGSLKALRILNISLWCPKNVLHETEIELIFQTNPETSKYFIVYVNMIFISKNTIYFDIQAVAVCTIFRKVTLPEMLNNDLVSYIHVEDPSFHTNHTLIRHRNVKESGFAISLPYRYFGLTCFWI